MYGPAGFQLRCPSSVKTFQIELVGSSQFTMLNFALQPETSRVCLQLLFLFSLIIKSCTSVLGNFVFSFQLFNTFSRVHDWEAGACEFPLGKRATASIISGSSSHTSAQDSYLNDVHFILTEPSNLLSSQYESTHNLFSIFF